MNKKKLFAGLFALLLVAQFIQIDKSVPEVSPMLSFENVAGAPAHIQKALKDACYDCHSYETKYPWYTYVAPVSWWIKGHIKNGREHLNFSTWGPFTSSDEKHLYHECAEEIESGHMPPKGYVRMHGEAAMSDELKQQVVAWFEAKSK